MTHKVSITRPQGDQRLVACTCGFSVWCLYVYEATGEKRRHLEQVKLGLVK